jgi:hypothetical protein
VRHAGGLHAILATPGRRVARTVGAGQLYERLPRAAAIPLGSAQRERDWLAAGIAYIESRALAAKESTEGFMVNGVVEVDESGGCRDYEWPSSSRNPESLG